MTVESGDEKFAEEVELAQQVGQGDQGALIKLYEIYIDRVYCYFYDRVGSRSEAKILTAETFHRAVNALMSDHYLWQDRAFGSWLYGIANNVFEQRNRAPLFEDLKRILERNELMSEGEDIVDFIVLQEERKMLWQLVYELQPLDQQIVILHHKSKLSWAVIAIRLGYSENDCEQLYDQALEKLKRRVQTFGLWKEIRRR